MSDFSAASLPVGVENSVETLEQRANISILSASNFKVIIAGLLIFIGCYIGYRPWDLQHGAFVVLPFGCDFINFWMAGRLSRLHETSLFTDLPAYNSAITAYFGHHPGDLLFSYPPHSLLILGPLSLLPYGWALCVWTGLNMGALALATRRLALASARPTLLVCVCLSPAALTMALYGQFGGLLALAALVVVLDSERRPWIAGLCLALMTVKPQMAAALGLIMLLSGRWRCLPVAACVTTFLIGLSASLSGIQPWVRFFRTTLPVQNLILMDGQLGMVKSTLSVFRAGQLLHLPSAAAWAAQIIVILIAIGLPVLAFRRGLEPLRLAFVAPLGVILAQPYVNGYDLALFAPALTVLLLTRTSAARSSYAALGVWMSPPMAVMLNLYGLPLAPLVMIAALVQQGLGRRQRTGLVSYSAAS
jgi:hypothetical protein